MVNRRQLISSLFTLVLTFGAFPLYAGQRVDLEALKFIVTQDQNTVASAGTAEALDTAASIRSVIIKGLSGNTGQIYIGGSNVDSRNGFSIDSNESIILDLDDISDVWIDADTSGEGVRFLALR